MLSDVAIIEKIKAGEIQITDPDGKSVINTKTGAEIVPGLLQAHGYDLRAEAIYKWGAMEDFQKLEQGDEIIIQPNQFVVIKTFERIRLSRNIGATIHSLARLTLLGMSHISTTIHPGWAENDDEPEQLTVAVYNVSRVKISLPALSPICRAVFFEVVPASRPAPTSMQVRERFELVKHKMRDKYSSKTKLTGIVWLVLSTTVAASILLGIGIRFPAYVLGFSIPIVTTLLSLLITYLRRRYNFLSEL